MTNEEREQRARELAEHLYVIIQHGDEQHTAWLRRTLLDEARPNGSIHRMIASTEQQVLEEAAKLAETEGVYPELNVHNGGPEWYQHGKRISKRLRQQAKERGV